MSETYHAWYSAQNDRDFGSTIYLDNEGKEVRCSGVSKDKDKGEACYKWPDKVYLGVVSKFVRSEQKDRFRLDILDEYYPYGYIEDY